MTGTPGPAESTTPSPGSSSGSSSSSAGSGSGGSAGGYGSTQTPSSSTTFTDAPPPPPSFSATATYTGSTSGQTFDAKPGRLTIDQPASGASLAGTAVLSGRMVDPDLLGRAITVQGIATWGTQSWPFGQALVAADGHWEMTWDTRATPDGRHLLPDGGYRIAIEGAGSSVEASYTLANGQWLKTQAANVTFEGPNEGPVWVNATWQGSSGFRPGLAWLVVTGTESPVHVPLTVTTTTDAAGAYHVSFTASLQVQPVEHEPLDVQLEVEHEGGGAVAYGLARRPEPGTVVTSRARGDIAWAAPAAGLAVTGLAAAAFVSTEAGRFWLVRLAPIGLFARIRGDEAKKHRRREQLLQLVEARPGITFRDLGREAGLRGGVLAHHVATLEREGLVRRQRVGTRLQFHPAGPPPAPIRQIPALQATLLRLVQASPGITQSEAARRMAVSRQALHYHVMILRKAGLLAVAPNGRESLLSLAPAAALRVWTCPSCRSLMEGQRGGAAGCPACGARLGAAPAAAAG
jgi:DNA-binding MarR family transcriptional regulator